MGERVADLIATIDSPDIKLRIRSCRPKRSWDNRLPVFYGDELYEVAEEQQGESPHRFIYLLRHKPGNKLVRETYHYDPNEVLSSGTGRKENAFSLKTRQRQTCPCSWIAATRAISELDWQAVSALPSGGD